MKKTFNVKFLTYFLVIGLSACSYKPIFSEKIIILIIEKILTGEEKYKSILLKEKLKI